MEVRLNLLPGYRKQEIKNSRLFGSFLRFELSVIFIGLLFISLLWGYNTILGINFNVAKSAYDMEAGNSKYDKVKYFDQEFEDANVKINDALTFKKSQFYWSNMLTLMNNQKMDGITISGLATNNFTVSLSGMSENRDYLTAFKNELENNNCITDVNLPLSDLVKKEDVAFQLDFKIKEECLKK